VRLLPEFVCVPLGLLAGSAILCWAGIGCGGASSSSPFGGSSPTDASPAVDSDEQPDAMAHSVADAATLAFALPDGARGASGCQPGTYAGQYTGTFDTLIPTTGPVAITLTRQTVSTGENELVTNGGTWDTTWGPSAGDASIPLEEGHATLVGELDCSAGSFTAMGENAYFTILGQDSGTFTLNLNGAYDAATETISGMFTYTSNDGNGQGTWQVTLTD